MKKREKTEMDKLVEPMIEHVCDKLCRHPQEIGDQEILDQVCGDCEMGQHVWGF